MVRILIIEDEEQVRKLIATLLQEEGYEALEAPNGKIGSQLFHNHRIDLIITDIFMPEKEGLETIRELKDIQPNIKIIAMSGGGQKGNMDFLPIAKHLGADYTLAKPFSIHTLLSVVQQLVPKS
jgi:CheY-like chemotaxis protein